MLFRVLYVDLCIVKLLKQIKMKKITIIIVALVLSVATTKGQCSHSNFFHFPNRCEHGRNDSKDDSLKEVRMLNNVSVFPNPTTKWINIRTEAGLGDIYEVTVFGVNYGNVIDDFSGTTRFDVSTLQNGLWTCIIVYKNGKYTSKNFIKQ